MYKLENQRRELDPADPHYLQQKEVCLMILRWTAAYIPPFLFSRTYKKTFPSSAGLDAKPLAGAAGCIHLWVRPFLLLRSTLRVSDGGRA